MTDIISHFVQDGTTDGLKVYIKHLASKSCPICKGETTSRSMINRLVKQTEGDTINDSSDPISEMPPERKITNKIKAAIAELGNNPIDGSDEYDIIEYYIKGKLATAQWCTGFGLGLGNSIDSSFRRSFDKISNRDSAARSAIEKSLAEAERGGEK